MPPSPDTVLTLADVRAMRGEILRLAARYGVTNVRVFGSVARGDAGPASDVDFLVDFPPDFSLLKLSGLVRSLQECIGRRVEVASAQHLREELRDSILNDAQPL